MKKILFISLCALFFAQVQAQDIPAKLRAMHPADEKIECGFSETRVMPKVNKTEKHEGSLVYQAPDYLRMDYTDPAGDYILITEEKMEQCKKGKVQSVKVKGRDNRYTTYRATLLSCLAGDIDKAAQLNDAKAECKQENKKYVCTVTAEKATGKDIKQVRLEYEVTTGKVLTITLTEGNGNYATYTVR